MAGAKIDGRERWRIRLDSLGSSHQAHAGEDGRRSGSERSGVTIDAGAERGGHSLPFWEVWGLVMIALKHLKNRACIRVCGSRELVGRASFYDMKELSWITCVGRYSFRIRDAVSWSNL